MNFKISKKHFKIFKEINKKGYYKPTYSDQEPATKTLIKNNIIEWRSDYKGLIFTNYGKEFVDNL